MNPETDFWTPLAHRRQRNWERKQRFKLQLELSAIGLIGAVFVGWLMHSWGWL